MNELQRNGSTSRRAADAMRLVEDARAAELGHAPEDAARSYRDALSLLGDTFTAAHADVLRWHGTLLRDRGRTTEAERLYRRSLEIARQMGYQLGVAHALNCIAGIDQRRGDLRHAARLLADAALIADATGETRLLTMIHSNLGILADVRGDTEAAMSHYRAALLVSETAGNEQEVLWVLINFGVLLGRRGKPDEAERLIARALSIARVRGDAYSEGVLQENRAELLLIRGDLDEASVAIGRALEVATLRRDDVRAAGALKLRGAYERLRGWPDAAANTLRHGLTLAAVGEDALQGAELLHQFGLALHGGDNETLAREVWAAALDAFERIGATEWVDHVRACIDSGPSGRYL
jgi:tetratricopeptide (TPR) repeat protein